MDPVDLRYEGPAAVTCGLLAGEGLSDRVCDAIPDEQCTAVPGNYLRNLANGSATKLAEQLAGPNLVLPWLLAATGAPAAVIGLLAPVRQAGAMLPLGEPASGVGSPWAFALVFVGLGIAESGVRLGRKTWLVDTVEADDRPLYVAFANSTMGAVTLAWGALGLVAQAAGVPLLLGLLALAGAVAAARMPEADRFRG